jgi:hypothetical protein
MNQSNSNCPKARRTQILVDTVGDETIVYDEQCQKAHSLNRSASSVWRNSNGERSIPELANLLGSECGLASDESLVEYALDELAGAHLLEDNRVTRRSALRRLTLTGAAVVGLPVVLSIVAPTPAMAASGTGLPVDPGPD